MKNSSWFTSRHGLTVAALICITAIADAALRNPPWLRPPQPVPTAKSRPAQPKVEITEKDGFRYISSNGIPDHLPGVFPNSGNPNAIREQKLSFRMTLQPKFADELTHAVRYPMGVALNGVPFEPGTAEVWNFDKSLAGTTMHCPEKLISVLTTAMHMSSPRVCTTTMAFREES